MAEIEEAGSHDSDPSGSALVAWVHDAARRSGLPSCQQPRFMEGSPTSPLSALPAGNLKWARWQTEGCRRESCLPRARLR
jgi:hypothetical protein